MLNHERDPVILAQHAQANLTGLEPLTQKIFLQLPPPEPQDNRAVVDRLRQSLEPDFGRVEIPLSLMAQIPGLIQAACRKVTATLAESGTGWKLIALEPGDTRSKHLGLAIDIGTTTVVVYLVDLTDGAILNYASDYNGQVPLGEDILSRIRCAGEPGGLRNLRQEVLKTLNQLIRQVCPPSAGKHQITAAAIGANTTMIHLFLGLDPTTISREPYTPLVNYPGLIPAAEIGLDIHPLAPVYCLPSVGSFLGGDVVAGILVSGMHRQREISLFVDIGTNGEIVMGCADWLVACAGAAGPALEGGVAAHGMRAESGAVDRVEIVPETGRVKYTTIHDALPRGICGSGLVDILAELFLTGVVDRTARFRSGDSFLIVPSSETNSRLREDILVTQTDLDHLMATKGAVNAAIDLLMENVGCSWQEIRHFYAAGAFGQYLPIESAITVGLYPDLPRSAIVRLGNSSGEGARQVLLSRAKRLEAEDIASRVTYFELNASSSFMEKFRSSKFLPHTDLERYPSVREKLKAHKRNF